jgi:hypothetical protein
VSGSDHPAAAPARGRDQQIEAVAVGQLVGFCASLGAFDGKRGQSQDGISRSGSAGYHRTYHQVVSSRTDWDAYTTENTQKTGVYGIFCHLLGGEDGDPYECRTFVSGNAGTFLTTL